MNEIQYFTKKERISWMVMLLIIVISIYVPNIFMPENPTAESPPLSSFQIDSLIQIEENSKTFFDQRLETNKTPKNSKSNWQKHSASQKKKNINHSKLLQFNFDPNLISDDSIRLLFSKYVAQNMIKYRSFGGKFRKKEDLLKIYGMDTFRYQTLLPFIHFKKVESQIVLVPEQASSPYQEMIGLNVADTTMLKQLKGIGSVLAQRIIAFRNALGGFHSVEQLQETYGLSQETYVQIRPFLELGKPHQKMKLNNLDQKAMSSHPYINWKQAKWIEQYRKQHGPFTSVTDIYQIRMLDSNFVSKLKPYLEFQALVHTDTLTKSNFDLQ